MLKRKKAGDQIKKIKSDTISWVNRQRGVKLEDNLNMKGRMA